MDTGELANVLFAISAHAERHGLVELGNKVIEAASIALLEIPGANRNTQLVELAEDRWLPSKARSG